MGRRIFWRFLFCPWLRLVDSWNVPITVSSKKERKGERCKCYSRILKEGQPETSLMALRVGFEADVLLTFSSHRRVATSVELWNLLSRYVL